jgi:hypothetical protein
MKKAELHEEKAYEILSLFEKTNKEKPKPENVQALRKILAEIPDLWRIGGNLAQQNQLRLLRETSMTPGVRETLEAAVNGIRHELGYDVASMLEQLLIEQVLLAWLRLNIWEQQLTGMEKAGMTLTKAAFWEKRISAAYSRYLRSCETLARVRRLMKNNPMLQVNIATQDGKQVNIAGDVIKNNDS